MAEQNKINEAMFSELRQVRTKLSWVFGGLAVLLVMVNVIGPVLIKHFVK